MTDRTGQTLRITANTRRILAVLVSADAPMWGVHITQKCGLPYNTGRPVIIRLEEHGWVERSFDEGPARPARHLFQLTRDGRIQAEALLRETAQ